MPRRTTLSLAAAFAAATFLALAGCGGGGTAGPLPYDGPLTVPYHGSGSSTNGSNDSGDPTGDAGTTITWHRLDAGYVSPTTSFQTLVARDEVGYATLRAMANTTNAPAVDFQTEMVVGIFLGARPTGGYGVNVLDVIATTDGGVNVKWAELLPVPGMIVTQAVTQPWILVALTRRDGPVTFTGSVLTSDPAPQPK